MVNPRIFIGGAIGGIAIVIVIMAIYGSEIFNQASQSGFSPQQEVQEIIPLSIELESIEILEVTNEYAKIQIKFKTTNLNPSSAILHVIKYQLYEKDLRIATNEIGEKPSGMVAGSNYFTLLSNNPVVISDDFTIRNTGNTPELWDALQSGNPQWTVKGEASYNLSSMTSGGENEAFFEIKA